MEFLGDSIIHVHKHTQDGSYDHPTNKWVSQEQQQEKEENGDTVWQLVFFLVENGWMYRFTFSSLENNMPLVFTDSLSPSQTHFLLFSQVDGCRVAHKQLLYSSLVTAAASVEESIILTPFSAKRKFVVSECVLLLPIFLLSLIQQSQPLEPAIHPPSHFCFFLCVCISLPFCVFAYL